MEWIYESGYEVPEILGSGSTFYNVFFTRDEKDAISSLNNGRNYLTRFKKEKGLIIDRQYYDSDKNIWVDA